ncbi:hypothetical protein BB558_006460 [Smittium angustum]|uniref:CCHC-type domain-containing protein n=1 Tax=Smittium angustum TaxID=133377 RepID=A0A2U1IXN0_SMIAN|nr:hypothetical protein BB558_006460 [Smittium angustum]
MRAEQNPKHESKFCYICKKPGHIPYYCPTKNTPDFKQTNNNISVSNNTEKPVNYIELASVSSSIFKKDENKIDMAEVFVADKRKSKKVRLGEEVDNMVDNSEMEIDNERAIKSTAKKNYISTNSNLGKEKYSIQKELTKTKANISLAQLLRISPIAKEDLVQMLKNTDEVSGGSSQINNIGMENNTSNCKAIIEIKGNQYSAILDTGAACSVVSSSLVKKLGLSITQSSNQQIITADGAKHPVKGVVTNFPVSISNILFPIDVV